MNARGILLALLLAGAGPAAAQSLAPPGASACSGCHPATAGPGAPVLSLNGRAPNDIVVAMQAFRSGERPATVMDRITKGFSDDEIQAIAAWLGAQR